VLEALAEGMSSAGRQAAHAIHAASLIAYVVLLHAVLSKAWKACSGVELKRLLLLRVFGSADKRERLLDALDDTWRRVGRIDLIAGTDLAMRTLRSWMFDHETSTLALTTGE
jgi:hypothetical protein